MGRWDFDTQEEYSEYMSRKEALPKAAFQYGVKMAEGLQIIDASSFKFQLLQRCKAMLF